MKKIIALLLVAAMSFCLCSCGLSNEDKYNSAVADVKAGNYDKAIETFEALNGYQDSDKYIMYARCLKAGDSGDFETAIKNLQTLGDFKEASMYVKYYTALSYEAEQEYENAQEVYDEILLFNDVQERSGQIPDKILDRDLAEALQLIDDESESYDGHRALVEMLSKKYSTSDTLMYEKVMEYAKAKYDGGDYFTAARVYLDVVDTGYAEAEEPFKAAIYSLAEQSIDEKNYLYAKSLITKFITGYTGADALLNECNYQLTLLAVAINGPEAAQDAYDTFIALGTYKDSADRAKAYEDQYAAAVAKRNDGEYDAAVELFTQLGTYSDSATQITETDYQEATALMNEGKYEEAIAAFGALDGYSDSASQIEACENAILDREYQAATALMDEGKYKEAIAAFGALDGYKDSADRIKECTYLRAGALAAEGKYDEAYAVYATVTGYKDVDKIIAEDENIAAAYRAQFEEGKTVTFGNYGGKAIEWLVLENDGESAIMIAVKGLDAKPYNTERTSVTYETCTLRTWLNGEFLNAAFTAEEQAKLNTVMVKADRNPKYSTNPGKGTQDKVWLLSIQEAEKYFPSYGARVCYPTQKAKDDGATTYDTGACWWWLRSPGGWGRCAAKVSYGGSVNHIGNYVYIDNGCVRPVVSLRLN